MGTSPEARLVWPGSADLPFVKHKHTGQNHLVIGADPPAWLPVDAVVAARVAALQSLSSDIHLGGCGQLSRNCRIFRSPKMFAPPGNGSCNIVYAILLAPSMDFAVAFISRQLHLLLRMSSIVYTSIPF